jgi:hypothetical protein
MDVTQARQMRVASLHLRGLSPAEIQSALQGGGIPCDLETVCEDIKFLERVWTMEARPTPRHKARVLAELREARRAAWAAGDLQKVLESIKFEAELLHLKASL